MSDEIKEAIGKAIEEWREVGPPKGFYTSAEINERFDELADRIAAALEGREGRALALLREMPSLHDLAAYHVHGFRHRDIELKAVTDWLVEKDRLLAGKPEPEPIAKAPWEPKIGERVRHRGGREGIVTHIRSGAGKPSVEIVDTGSKEMIAWLIESISPVASNEEPEPPEPESAPKEQSALALLRWIVRAENGDDVDDLNNAFEEAEKFLADRPNPERKGVT